MSLNHESLEAFMQRTCGGKSLQVLAVEEFGLVIRVCCVDSSAGTLKGKGKPASVLDVRIPWEALEDAESEQLKSLFEYDGAEVQVVEHYGTNQTPEKNRADLIVCGTIADPDTLFKLGVFYASALDRALAREP